MTVYRLGADLAFPPVDEAEEGGLLAVGGDLATERLLLAYREGIFPWYEKSPILWFSPDPRMVLRAEDLRVSRSLRKTLRKGLYRITLDTVFERVIEGCARIRRPSQRTTWITPGMRRAYGELHRQGFAHSAEAWRGDALVGGLYGVSLGGAFFGESMFAKAPDASKAAFAFLVERLAAWGIGLIDCQVYTPHLARFGATLWPRRLYLAELRRALRKPTRAGPWSADPAATP
ncbi:MAG TPA: leucyl/phenylalanyl-tRNA--protein transferase [Vicinamibacteria bacterium]|nr:leucyl/phenylalanyl-tRNA--protein transferase [Vicinamibacteria bacterium]